MADQEEIVEIPEEEAQLLSEYKDGQLQIVEVRPFEKDVMLQGQAVNTVSELDVDGETKCIQLVNPGDKSMMQLDLLNLTLVRSDDGTELYRLLTNGETADDGETMVTCVLASSDNEGNEDAEDQDYVVMESDGGPVMFLQSSQDDSTAAAATGSELQTVNVTVDTDNGAQTEAEKVAKSTGTAEQPKKMTPMEILERAKALQKAKALMVSSALSRPYVRRKRKSDLPPPHELLSSPGFKLFLYSCKYCNFKCNATKEMTAHRLAEHSSGGGGGNGSKLPTRTKSDRIALQCARCPYKGHTHTQLMKHVQDLHAVDEPNTVYLNTEEVQAADVLVCGACGFESSSRFTFRRHLEKRHGATTV